MRQRYELPAFGTLDRLAGHVRSIVNTRLFKRVARKLSTTDRHNLDNLLVPDSVEMTNANLNLLKSPPKSHKLKHIKELQDKFDTTMVVGDAQQLLSFIPATKVKSFAALARTLDISEFNDFRLPKRRTLLLCLLAESEAFPVVEDDDLRVRAAAQVKTRDHMVEMFLKRIKKIHNNAKTKLEYLREKYLNQTQAMLELFGEILVFSQEFKNYTQLGKQVQGLLDNNGGTDSLLGQYSEIAAVNTKNHFPLLWLSCTISHVSRLSPTR